MLDLVTADLHLSAEPRDAYRSEGMDWLLELARKTKPDRILVLGDLCEQKDFHGATLVNLVTSLMYNLADIAPLTVLMGNHDYRANPDNPFFRFLGAASRIQWVDRPQVVGNDLFLPHSPRWQEDWCGPVFERAYNRIFAHETFEGARVGPRALNGVPLSALPKHNVVYSGDVHVPQLSGGVCYVGAPSLVDFGDDYTPRVLQLTDTTDTSIPCQGPQKRLIELSWSSGKIAPTWIAGGSTNPGDMVKLRVNLPVSVYPQWAEIQEAAKIWASGYGLQVWIVVPQYETLVTQRGEPGQAASRSDEQVFDQYCQARAVDAGMKKAGLAYV